MRLFLGGIGVVVVLVTAYRWDPNGTDIAPPTAPAETVFADVVTRAEVESAVRTKLEALAYTDTGAGVVADEVVCSDGGSQRWTCEVALSDLPAPTMICRGTVMRDDRSHMDCEATPAALAALETRMETRRNP